MQLKLREEERQLQKAAVVKVWADQQLQTHFWEVLQSLSWREEPTVLY